MLLSQRPQAFLFDLDGTLLDTEPLYTVATNRVLEPFGATLGAELKGRIMGRDPKFGARLVCEAYGLPYTPEVFLEHRERHLLQLFTEAPELPGARRLLEELKGVNAPVAIATSSPRDHMELKLTNHDWLRGLAVFVCGDDPGIGARKPAPDIFLAAAQRLDVEPRACVVFEDSPAGVQAGVAAGMAVIAVPDSRIGAVGFPESDWTVASLEEVTLAALGWGQSETPPTSEAG